MYFLPHYIVSSTSKCKQDVINLSKYVMDCTSVHFHTVCSVKMKDIYEVYIWCRWICNSELCLIFFVIISISFLTKHGEKSHWNPNSRPSLVTMQGATAYWTHLLLPTNPVLCPSRKMHFDGSIIGLISVHVKQFSIYLNLQHSIISGACDYCL